MLVPRTFQPYFLCVYWITYLECPSFEVSQFSFMAWPWWYHFFKFFSTAMQRWLSGFPMHVVLSAVTCSLVPATWAVQLIRKQDWPIPERPSTVQRAGAQQVDLNEINFSSDDKLLFVTSEFSYVCPLCSFPFGDVFRIQSITLSWHKSCSRLISGGTFEETSKSQGWKELSPFVYTF